MTRFELVLTRWEDGLFKSRDRIEVDNIELLEQQFEAVISNIQVKMAEETELRYKIADDDEIPF